MGLLVRASNGPINGLSAGPFARLLGAVVCGCIRRTGGAGAAAADIETRPRRHLLSGWRLYTGAAGR